MPILTLQQRSRELGRIRIGQQVNTGRVNDDGEPILRPSKLDRFRLTATSRPLLDRVAGLYGGQVQDWDNNGSPQFEVIIAETRLPILVPPQPISQYFELWSGGGCKRRCDGQTELLKDKPCPCGPDPAKRKCKPTTRLNVILRDVAGIGTWRLESHGYYSATELPQVAAFLAHAGTYAPAWLSLEERKVVREGKTHRWMVPTIEVDVTPAELLAGNGVAAEIGQRRTLELAPTSTEPSPVDIAIRQWLEQAAAAVSLDALHELWQNRPAAVPLADAQKALESRAAQLRAQAEQVEQGPPPVTDELWMEALSAAPENWQSADVERHFAEVTGVQPGDATAEDMQRYLDTAYPKAEPQAGEAA